MGFLKQEYWSGLPFSTPGDLPTPGIEPASLASPALADGFFTTMPPGKPQVLITYLFYICACVLSCFSYVRLTVTPWTVAHQTALSKGFSRQEYWSVLLFPSPGDLPNPGIETASLASPALAGRFFTTSATWEVPVAEPH